jgi:O-antigen ligase
MGVVITAAVIASQRHFETRGLTEGFPPPIAYADVPRWGVNVALEQYDDAALQSNLDAIRATGFAWIRQSFPWAKIEPQRGKFDWSAWDRIVNAAGDQGSGAQGVARQEGESLQWIAVLDTSPDWARAQSLNSDLRDPPSDPADFARFAGEFARRYGDRVHVYQIWDEPNLGDRWNGEVSPVDYVEMLRQAREAIRANDPQAVIVLAGLAPTVENSRANMSDWLYLRRLYEVGAREYFDVVSGKPYGFSTGPDDRRVDPDVLNFSHIVLMREEMELYGDGNKPLWASHFGWNSLPAGWTGKPSLWGRVTQDQQARYTLDAMQRVEREWPWMSVMVLENWQPDASSEDPHWGFAIADRSERFHVQASPGNGMGYHPAARTTSFASTTYTGGLAEFSPPGHWSFTELGADWSETGDQVRILFRGTGLALHVRRAADRANFYITVDGQPANALPHDSRGAFLQLIPPDVQHASVDMVPVATGLPDGLHTAEIVAERGWSQRSLVGWSVQVEPAGALRYHLTLAVSAVLSILFVAGGVASARRASWGGLAVAVSALNARLGDVAHAALMVVAACVFYASAWLTWGQEIPSAFRRVGDGPGIAAMLGLSVLFYYSPWLFVTLLSALALLVLILFRLDLGLALVALVVPFYLLPRALNSYVFSMAEIVLVMCLVAWALRQSRRLLQLPNEGIRGFRGISVSTLAPARSANVRLSALDWAALAFVAVSFASLFVAEYPWYALREFRGIVLEPALFYLMLRTTVRRDETLWRCVDALMLAGVIVALVGLVQYSFNINIITAEAGQHRLRSVYGSPNNVGLFLGRVLPVLVAIALLGHGRRRWVYGLSAVPVAAAVLLSFSKGALLLGVPAALLVLGGLAGGRWLWAAIAAVGAGGLAAIPLLRTPRFQSLLDLTSGTSFFRLNVWQSAVLMIRDHPILGVGLDNFLYQYRGRYMFPEAWAEPMLSHPHNVVLDYAARLGLLGLASGVWLQVAFWRVALPLRKLSEPLGRALAIGLMASMADFLAHGLVDAAFFVPDLAYVFFLTLALIQALHIPDNL